MANTFSLLTATPEELGGLDIGTVVAGFFVAAVIGGAGGKISDAVASKLIPHRGWLVHLKNFDLYKRAVETMLRKFGFEPLEAPDATSLLMARNSSTHALQGLYLTPVDEQVTPVDEQDFFHVDLVWNKKPEFPFGSRVHSVSEAMQRCKGILRLGELCTPGEWDKFAWKLYEEPDLLSLPIEEWPTGPPPIAQVEKRIPELVDDLEKHVVDYVIDFFDKKETESES